MVGRMAKAKKAKKHAKKRATDDALHQPHDALVQYAFSQREHAAGLLKAILPGAIVALVDWGALELVKDSFIDPELRRSTADLLLSAPLAGKRALFYVLVEHKRDVEPLAIFQVSRYMHRIWDKVRRDDPGLAKLPPILPVLLCNTKTGWTAATRFEDVVDIADAAREALLDHTPCFGALLVDLHPDKASDIADRWLTAYGKVVLWALSVAGDDERFHAEIDRMRDAYNAASAAPDGHGAIFALLRYLCATHQKLGAKRIQKLLLALAEPQQKKVIMDVLDELRQEGREEGRTEGRAEGRTEGRTEGGARLLLKLLTKRFGPVPANTKAQVLAAKQPTLDRWAERLLTASSLQAVFRTATPPPKTTARPRKSSRAARA
jgi:predicted transposase YdaD